MLIAGVGILISHGTHTAHVLSILEVSKQRTSDEDREKDSAEEVFESLSQSIVELQLLV